MASFFSEKSQVNGAICHLHRAIHSRNGLDITILFAGEAARLSAVVFELFSHSVRIPGRKLESSVASPLTLLHHSWMTKLIGPLGPFTSKSASVLRNLTTVLEEWQMLNRCCGLLDMWIATRDFINRDQAKEGRHELVVKIRTITEAVQIALLTIFHLSEAAALLSAKKLFTCSPRLQAQLSYLSIRAWAAWTFTEIVRVVLECLRLSQYGKMPIPLEFRNNLRKELFRNLAWAPVTLHWSLPRGLLPETIVTPLGAYATLSLMKEVWEASAGP